MVIHAASLPRKEALTLVHHMVCVSMEGFRFRSLSALTSHHGFRNELASFVESLDHTEVASKQSPSKWLPNSKYPERLLLARSGHC